jgi:hypothetical protein
MSRKTAALTQAISGLGGIEKTQIAVEYAYLYRDKYQAVLWVKAATRDTLNVSFLDLARLLKLPEKAEQDQTITIQAVKRWLEHHTSGGMSRVVYIVQGAGILCRRGYEYTVYLFAVLPHKVIKYIYGQ